jgi:hypothetical protein
MDMPNAASSLDPATQQESAQSPLPIQIQVDVDSKSECGYQGGVNHYVTDDNMGSDSQQGGSDARYETMSEFDEGDVEEMRMHATNMKESLYSQIQVHKSMEEWKNTEANGALGYNGHSSRTIRQQNMEARKQQAVREHAKTS